MSLRVCLEPGCPTLTNKSRCKAHERAKDAARGTRQQRGYDATHDALRKTWEPIVASGSVRCWRCNQLIQPEAPWDLGHDDRDRTKYRGPECIKCNRGTATRR